MIFLRKILLTSFVSLFLVVPAVLLFAQTGRKAAVRLDRLVKDLDLIQQEQEKILKYQDETIEAIKNLKIWSRR